MLYGGSASLYAGSALSTGVPLAPSEAELLSWARLTESEIQIHKSFLVILSGLHCLLLGPRGYFLQCRIFWIFPFPIRDYLLTPISEKYCGVPLKISLQSALNLSNGY